MFSSHEILLFLFISSLLAPSAERKALDLVVVGSSPTVGVKFEDKGITINCSDFRIF